MNDCIISIIILGIIFFGTKLVNYYYNFYHIYNYLDYEQKLGYFKSTNLINLISKYPIVKKIIVYYFLIPIIKLNYLFISTFITLLYSLCYFEFKKILKDQKQKKYKHKKNKKKTYNYILSETSNDSIKYLNNLTNGSNLIVNVNNSDADADVDVDVDADVDVDVDVDDDVDVDIKSTTLDNTAQYIILKNDILNVNKIDTDYNNGILNIIEFTTEINNDDNNFMTKFEKINENNEDKSNIYLTTTNMDELKLENMKNKYNLLNEIDLLKKPDVDENINNYLNDSLNINNKKGTNNIDNIFNNDFLLNDLNNLNDDNNENENENNNENDINEYLIIDNKIKNTKNEKIKMIDNKINETNETINYDDIDFGVKIEELNITNIKPNTQLTVPIEKKVIKIGKKKNKQ